MTLTIDIPEKIVERANEMGVPVSTLVAQTLDVAVADVDRRPPPMLGTAQPHRIPVFSGPAIFTRAEREYLAAVEKWLQERLERVTRTPQLAFQELVDAGIYQSDGQLAEHYR